MPIPERVALRLTAVAGVLSIVFVIAAFIYLGNYPDESASGDEVVRYVGAHRTALLSGVYLFGVSLVFMLVFLAGLWAVLRRSEDGSGFFASLFLVGGLIWVAVFSCGLVFLLALAYRKVSDPAIARSFLDGAVLMPNLVGFPTAVNLFGFAAIVLARPIFPRWLGWSALVVAAVHLASAGAMGHKGLFTPSIASGLIAPILYYAWVLAASYFLWSRSRVPLVATPPAFN